MVRQREAAEVHLDPWSMTAVERRIPDRSTGEVASILDRRFVVLSFSPGAQDPTGVSVDRQWTKRSRRI